MRRVAGIALAILLSTSALAAEPTGTAGVGEVEFANSGAPAAQAAFQRGIALLHNFEYARAATAFQEAQKADPQFMLAYWGEAMTHNHPVWMQQDRAAALAALAKLGATPSERLAKARTNRERGLLQALETLYGEGDKKDRDRRYSAAMEQLHRAYPNDVDIASLYALSLLGLAHDGRDFGLYMRAASTLEEYFPRHQRHPGVLHYLIHSYDDATHAPLGLRAARLYGSVAPDAAHALHMTSHIFVALGDWPATIDANRAAIAASNAQRKAAGRPEVMCGHYPEWLAYAYFQAGKPADGEAVRKACLDTAAGKVLAGGAEDESGAVESYALMLLREWIEKGGRAGSPSPSLQDGKYPEAAFALAYGDVIANRSNPAALAAAHRKLKSLTATVNLEEAHPLMATRQRIVLLQAEGLEAIASGRREQGLAALRQAAELERAMAPDYGPPLIEKPSFELLGEELIAAGRLAEASEALEQALKMAPGRKLAAAALAMAQVGQPATASAAAAAPHTH